MSSSTSSSDPAWRRLALRLAAVAFALVAIPYLFVIVIDPWDTLPLSPSLPRVPISGNARFSFPALARSPRFDSILLGTSTTRLLQPAQLDPLFHARFANLAMNSATAWEQTQLLQVFLRAHPAPRTIIIGLDGEWCGDTAPETTARPFPRWMYRSSRWPAYREMLNPYAIQEAGNQFATMIGLHRLVYGLDGYTQFVPDEAHYDPARVDAAFTRWPPTDTTPALPGERFAFPSHALLRGALAAIPRDTRTILFFAPSHIGRQGAVGSRDAARWAACKAAIVAIAAGRAEIQDFFISSAITTDRSNYWDPLHYRVSVATEVAQSLADGTGPNVRRLTP